MPFIWKDTDWLQKLILKNYKLAYQLKEIFLIFVLVKTDKNKYKIC